MQWREVPIDRSHDRKSFDCGVEALNLFLLQYARKAHESGTSKTWVAVNPSDSSNVLGYYTVSPAEVELHRVPEIARPGGRHAVGGFRLGRLAVDKRLQGRGLGGQLLAAAIARCMRASSEIGGTMLLIDAKDELAAQWYKLFGAVPLNDSPLTLLLPYMLYQKAVESAQ